MSNYIITIGRQYGSGGHEIGEKIAADLGIKFYDNSLIDRVSKESGLCKEIIMEHDEKPTTSFLYNLITDPYSVNFNRGTLSSDMPYGQKIFLAQFDTVKKIAEEGSCVIVGRCADYILKDKENLLRVFIYADKDFRLSRIASENPGLSEKNLLDLLDKKDRLRDLELVEVIKSCTEHVVDEVFNRCSLRLDDRYLLLNVIFFVFDLHYFACRLDRCNRRLYVVGDLRNEFLFAPVRGSLTL